MSEKIDKLKERLTNELGDKLRSVEMDVTSSFLSGKICSPLLATVDNAAIQADAIARGTLNTAAAAGLYITKDGLRYDPTVMTDAAGLIVNSAMQSVTSELIRLKDNAIREITYIPDPSIIVKKAISYFAYNVQNEIKINELLDNLSVNVDDKEEERQDKLVEDTHNKINEFITYNLPQISDKINNISYNINNVTNMASSYMAFGPEWVSEKVAYYIADGSDIAESFLNDKTKKINDYKIELYNRAAKAISDEMTKKYEELIAQNVKAINDEIEIGKQKAKLKGVSLIQKANLAIMAKTGIKIPIDKIKPENLSKLKRTTELSKLLGLASQAIPQNGPETSNDNEITNAETSSEQEKYQKELLEKRSNQLHQLARGLWREILNIDNKIEFIYSKDDYNASDSDEVASLENERRLIQNIAAKADSIEADIKSYIATGDDIFETWKQDNIRSIRNGFEPWHAESLDKLMETVMNLLTQNSYASSSEKMMVWDDEADDYVEISNVTGSEEVEIIEKRKQQETVPEMYAQNFMNAGGNGPVGV